MTLTAVTPQLTDVERFSDILCCATRHLPPRRRAAIGDATEHLKKFKAALLARRGAIEEAITPTSAIVRDTRQR
jgi:ABC-type transporter Mla subunit MlaD